MSEDLEALIIRTAEAFGAPVQVTFTPPETWSVWIAPYAQDSEPPWVGSASTLAAAVAEAADKVRVWAINKDAAGAGLVRQAQKMLNAVDAFTRPDAGNAP